MSARGLRNGDVMASSAAPRANLGLTLRRRSKVRSGNAIHRSSRRMRPLRVRTCNSSPRRSLRSARISGSIEGWRRCEPRSTLWPAMVGLAAIPPTSSALSRRTTRWPDCAARRAAASPVGPAPITTTGCSETVGLAAPMGFSEPVVAGQTLGNAVVGRPR